MSKSDTPTTESRTDETSDTWACEHREELEREANSDSPHAWVAERVLQSIEEGGS